MIYVAICAYATAMISANLLVVLFGPIITPLNAFVLIGFDLTMRDWLHIRIRPWQMFSLIGATGALTFLLNPAAGVIAAASATSFTIAALVDWTAFSLLRGAWFKRANLSNFFGSAVDSFLFPTLAFGVIMPQIVLFQFLAKMAGGLVWSWVLGLSSSKFKIFER